MVENQPLNHNPTPDRLELSRNVLGCKEELVWIINHFVEAGPSRKTLPVLIPHSRSSREREARGAVKGIPNFGIGTRRHEGAHAESTTILHLMGVSNT